MRIISSNVMMIKSEFTILLWGLWDKKTKHQIWLTLVNHGCDMSKHADQIINNILAFTLNLIY